MRLFESGRRMIEEICRVPVLGVVPYDADIHIEEEDSVALAAKRSGVSAGKINVAVVLVPHISNFTDFDAIERDPRVNLFYTSDADELHEADIIIIPGSKATLADLQYMRRRGIASAIVRCCREGKTVMGICGGYQMMGIEVSDPDGVEGDIPRLPGLGLLPVRTTLAKDKVTRRVSFSFRGSDRQCSGYEIHMGRTVLADDASPLNMIDGSVPEGCMADDRCFGTYIHGILDNQQVIDYILSPYLGKTDAVQVDYAAYKEEQYDALAALLRKHIDIARLYKIMGRDD